MQGLQDGPRTGPSIRAHTPTPKKNHTSITKNHSPPFHTPRERAAAAICRAHNSRQLGNTPGSIGVPEILPHAWHACPFGEVDFDRAFFFFPFWDIFYFGPSSLVIFSFNG